MLHRSFKPAKCKTALNLAKSRIKLMKNKKDIQVKQLRRELAHLLDSGQDQTARIRVEHVVREEKLMAAYELIELYCELIVARLPIIESQKNCPIDLKEAITSLIFAAPRCGDIPELQDVRKHFTAKYGKEFVAAAIELRPQCGVSRSMVEKLSVKAPDGPTKVKILTAIAEEHNIKWEPKWFKDEDPMPSADMQQKVQHVEQPGKIQMEPLNFDIGDSIQQPHAHDAARSASSSQSNAHVNEVQTSVTSRLNARPGSSSEKVVYSQSSGMGENAFPVAKQKWNMEFEDAAAAAHAAAESAERASMAARAAAELSTRSKMTSDDSSGPSASSVHGWSEGGRVYKGSVLQRKDEERNSANSSFNQRSPRVQIVQQNANERHHMTEGAEDKTLKEDYAESGVQYGNKEEIYEGSEISSYPVHQDMGRQSRDSFSARRTSEAESKVFDFSNRQEYGNEPSENPFHQEPVEMKRPPSSFQSDSGSLGDEYGIFSNLNHQNVKYDSDDDSFDSFNQGSGDNDDWHPKTTYPAGFYEVKENANLKEQGDRGRVVGSGYGFDSGRDIFVKADHRSDEMDVNKIGTQTDSAVVFDESGSDDDECILDPPQKSYDFPSPGKSSANQLAFPQKNSPGNLASQSSFSSHSHHGLDISESFRESPIYSKLIEPIPVSYDSDGASSGTETERHYEKTDPVIRSNDYGEADTNTVSNNEPQKSRDPGSQFQYESPPSPEGGMTLNFGMLPTGRRNRSNWRPPYMRGASSADSSSETYSKAAVNDAVGGSQETSSVLNYQVSSKEMENTTRGTSGLHARTNSTNDEAEVGFTHKGSDTRQVPYTATTHEFAVKTRSKDPTGHFDSDDSSSEEDPPKRPVIGKTPLGAGLSRRTKALTPRSVARTQPSITTDNVVETEHPSSSDATQVSPELQADYTGFRSTSRPRPQTKAWKENESLSSSAVEEVTSPARRTEIPRASNSSEKAPSRENSTKTPSHVHPKLPDFETLTAQLQSLRANRR